VKVALVTSFPAFPATAGNRSRIQQLAKAVMELGNELTFVLLPGENEFVDDAAHEAAFGKARYVKITGRSAGPNWPGKWTLRQVKNGLVLARDRVAGYRAGRWMLRQMAARRYQLLRLIGLHAPYYSALDRFRDPEWARQLARLGKDVDAVIVEYVFYSWAFDCFPESALRVLDAHDAFAERHRSYLAEGVSDYWISLRPQDESAGFRRADAILAIQQEEAQRFRRQLAAYGNEGGPEVVLVSHLMEQADAPVACDIGRAAIFLASANSANRHAVESFIRNVLPRVVRELPDFDLKLAGSICAHVPDMPNVTKLGWVQDVRTAFAQAAVSINPILLGTGINIKMLEAMAAGMPTISTATGIRGLPESYRNGVLAVADDDHAAFAAAIVRLAKDAELRRTLGRAAFDDARRWNTEQVAALSNCLRKPRELAARRAHAALGTASLEQG
jgi:polysaccharide biosynthesis protein PslH